MARAESRGAHAVRWIEDYCLVPHGPDKGQYVRLTPAQRDAVSKIFDTPDEPKPDVTGPLAAYLALLHICGPETYRNIKIERAADLFTVWNATGPELKAVLKREGEQIVCPELGTHYPAAA